MRLMYAFFFAIFLFHFFDFSDSACSYEKRIKAQMFQEIDRKKQQRATTAALAFGE